MILIFGGSTVHSWNNEIRIAERDFDSTVCNERILRSYSAGVYRSKKSYYHKKMFVHITANWRQSIPTLIYLGLMFCIRDLPVVF